MLRHFVAALEATGDDRRRQIAVVGDLLEDMAAHRSWGWTGNGLSRAREEAESALVRMTALPASFWAEILGRTGQAVLYPAASQIPMRSSRPRSIRRRYGSIRRSRTGPLSAPSMWGVTSPLRWGQLTLRTSI